MLIRDQSLVRSVIIRAICDQYRQTERSMTRAYKIIRRDFRRRIRAARYVTCRFREGRIVRAKIAVNLVRADMDDAEITGLPRSFPVARAA